MCQETQKMALSSNTLTLFERLSPQIYKNSGGQMPKRPELELFAIQPFTSRRGFHSFYTGDFIRNDLPLVCL
jgi:hypothetical protein